jgi:hypothetical protein
VKNATQVPAFIKSSCATKKYSGLRYKEAEYAA